ncbi:hypothetical protein SLS61_003700 [Didymella pomorum]
MKEIQEALRVEVYDRVGDKRPLGDIIKGKRSVLIFTRHFCTLTNEHTEIFKFKSALKEQGDGEEKKDYMQDAGTAMGRIFGGIKAALGDIRNTPYIGPKTQNGGEVIIAAVFRTGRINGLDETCHGERRMEA